MKGSSPDSKKLSKGANIFRKIDFTDNNFHSGLTKSLQLNISILYADTSDSIAILGLKEHAILRFLIRLSIGMLGLSAEVVQLHEIVSVFKVYDCVFEYS